MDFRVAAKISNVQIRCPGGATVGWYISPGDTALGKLPCVLLAEKLQTSASYFQRSEKSASSATAIDGERLGTEARFRRDCEASVRWPETRLANDPSAAALFVTYMWRAGAEHIVANLRARKSWWCGRKLR